MEWAQKLVDPVLRSSVMRLPHSVRQVADYHFGWSDESDGRPAGRGKSFRPALVFLLAQGVGGRTEAAVPTAVAVELVHNFSLLHDDVMDGDALRRHRPSAWTVFGIPQAILAGDALLTLALQVLAEQDMPATSDSVSRMSDTLLDLVDGQSADIAFENRNDVDLAECLAMASGKTSALIGAACMLGALTGGAPHDQAEYARQYGLQLGLAFQLVDDFLGVWGDPAVTGKPVFADLAARKKSLPVTAALTSGTTAGEELAALYERPDRLEEADLRRAAELIERAGGRRWCAVEVQRRLCTAHTYLDELGLASNPRADLNALEAALIEHDH
ncbi:polyprenyl synthetase family protein [Kitasatospora sp. NPDC059571]|uniref:polyprenyl synthetase family protein n=1 Tax=Kitasatospora sp. NPDC059571 TaxID=3346871 RepID=UPI0036BE0A55